MISIAPSDSRRSIAFASATSHTLGSSPSNASNPPPSSTGLSSLSDSDLFHRCRLYGHRTLYWRQKFIGLLPEVHRRKLYERKGFGSIFEFAKKLAGLTEEHVRLTLNLEKRLEQTPRLHQLLVNGEVSINKLARVVSIATQDNEQLLAEQVQLLPNRALETFVRDEKKSMSQAGSQKPQNDKKSLHVQTGNVQFSVTNQSCRAELNLDSDITQQLLELQQKGIDINAFLKQALQQRKEQIEEEKEKIAQNLTPTDSRYIPAAVKKIIALEHGSKCAIPTCIKASTELHHTARLSLSHSHNPYFLAPLCHEHHIIAHSIDQKFQERRQKYVNSR